MFGDVAAIDIIGMILAAFFTLLALLYAFGDNALFRLAIHVFVGVAAGYAGAVAIWDVLIPQFASLSFVEMVVPLLLIGMLLMKVSPRLAILGNPASAFLVGIGAAIAIGGAIQGTLLPQVAGASNFFSPARIQEAVNLGEFGTVFKLVFDGSIILVGTLATLISFHFSARSVPNQIPRRNRIIEIIASVGKVFISITFGVIFAGVYSAALTALIERVDFLIDLLQIIVPLAN
jgi:hypothetical protein